jgi:hypothetical protein
MKESAISKIISKILFIIANFFIFIFLISSITFFSLKHGISINNFDTNILKIEKLYIKWDEKFVIKIKSLDVKFLKQENNSNIDKLNAKKILNKITKIYTYFSSIDIENISIKGYKGSISYKEKGDAYINLYSKHINLKSKLFLDSHI